MTATLWQRRATRNQYPSPFVSARTCRVCVGTGVGEAFGVNCRACGGSGEAPPDAPPRLRIASPTNAQLDTLGRLIDRVDHRHPEVHFASDLIGRTDATESQVLATIAALEVLVPVCTPPPLRTQLRRSLPARPVVVVKAPPKERPQQWAAKRTPEQRARDHPPHIPQHLRLRWWQRILRRRHVAGHIQTRPASVRVANHLPKGTP